MIDSAVLLLEVEYCNTSRKATDFAFFTTQAGTSRPDVRFSVQQALYLLILSGNHLQLLYEHGIIGTCLNSILSGSQTHMLNSNQSKTLVKFESFQTRRCQSIATKPAAHIPLALLLMHAQITGD